MMKNTLRAPSLFKTLSLLSILMIGACSDDAADQTEPPVRGLKVFEVSQSASTESRRYPSLIEPANESSLSFEIAGQLGEVNLEEGQKVKAGDLLMRLDSTSLNLELQEARAALSQAEVTYKNANTDFDRKSQLLKNGNVTRASFDESQTNLRTAEAQRTQAARRYEIAEERLNKADLRAPFEGVIANVQGKSFTNVNAGSAVVTLYSQSAYEIGFNVPATVINQLNVGDQADVIITDLPGVTLKGRIQEISSRASQVSAFPVIVTLTESAPGLKAGMAAEAIVKFALPQSTEGFLVPLSSFNFEASESLQNPHSITDRNRRKENAEVYLFDESTSTVKARSVSIVGVRDNMLIVSEGLNAGDMIAAAGVSYLYDGQKVRRLPNNR